MGRGAPGGPLSGPSARCFDGAAEAPHAFHQLALGEEGEGQAEVAGATLYLADDVIFRSPVVFKPYEGREATLVVLGAVVQVFEDFRYTGQAEGDELAVLTFAARVGDRELEGVDILRFDEYGRVRELTVMVRPMSGMHALAERMRAMLEVAGAS